MRSLGRFQLGDLVVGNRPPRSAMPKPPHDLLTNPQLDPFGKLPEYKFCAAKVERAAMPGQRNSSASRAFTAIRSGVSNSRRPDRVEGLKRQRDVPR